MVNRTKQPEGCIGISEKCVFEWKSLSSRSGSLSVFFLAIVVLQVLLSTHKLAIKRMLQEVLSVKVVLKSSF